jgi:hypothetical protein
MNRVLPFAPLNRLSMLHDYVEPSERAVACPNQDVVYSGAIAAFDRSPVVLQVPDLGTRFWVYQIVDLRTDSFANIGIMYGTKPGFYLLTGPGWKGEVPKGITAVFTAKTNTAFVVPRVFQDDAAEDKQAIQAFIARIDMYPLAGTTGEADPHDWRKSPTLTSPGSGDSDAETRWVFRGSWTSCPGAGRRPAAARGGGAVRRVLAAIAAAKHNQRCRKHD